METNDYTNVSTFCPKCLKPLFYVGDVPIGGFPKGLEPYCTCSQKDDAPKGMLGWICPVCGAGLSPYTSICPCKTPEWKIIC